MSQMTSGSINGQREINLLNTIVNSVVLSETKLSEVISDEKLKERCEKVYYNEVGLDVDRSVESIGRFPTEFHNYELIAKGLIEYYDMVNFGTMQAEMIIKTARPKAVLFTNPSFVLFPHEYLEEAFNFNVYVPNDENVYREEYVISEGLESQLNVVDPLDIQNAVIPEDVDLIVTNGSYLVSNANPNILEDLYNALPQNGIILVLISNDYTNLYAKKAQSPLWDLHERIKSLPAANSYHIPTFIGFTVIVKN